MTKIIPLKITIFWFAKYIIFYIFMMFYSGNYAFILFGGLNRIEDFIHYLLYFSMLPIFSTILFLIPMYYIFKSSRSNSYNYYLIVLFIAESTIYKVLAAPGSIFLGIVNFIISLGVSILFFRKGF